MTAVPQVSVALDMDSGQFRLYAQCKHGGTDVAGPRLFRAQPWPEVKWSSATQEAAAVEARKLQAYLDAVYASKGPSKKKLREHGD